MLESAIFSVFDTFITVNEPIQPKVSAVFHEGSSLYYSYKKKREQLFYFCRHDDQIKHPQSQLRFSANGTNQEDAACFLAMMP